MVSPSLSTQLGSPTRQWSGTWPLSRIHCSTFTVPLMAGPSSSPVMRNEIEPLNLPAVCQEVDGGSGKGRDRTLHVGGATAEDEAIGNVGGKGRMRPALSMAFGHHIGVAGKTEMRSAGADAGEEIIDVGRAFVLEDQPVADEAVAREQVFEIGESAALGRRHGLAADQVLQQRDGIGGSVFHACILNCHRRIVIPGHGAGYVATSFAHQTCYWDRDLAGFEAPDAA